MTIKLDLDSPELENCCDGLGDAVVPKLREIQKAVGDEAKSELIADLSGAIAHEGTFFPGAGPAFPILVEEIAGMDDHVVRSNALLSLGSVVYAEEPDSVPDSLKEPFENAKADYLRMLKDELGRGIQGKDRFVHALTALVSGYGLYDLATSIDSLGLED
jgi:hypothetical protein